MRLSHPPTDSCHKAASCLAPKQLGLRDGRSLRITLIWAAVLNVYCLVFYMAMRPDGEAETAAFWAAVAAAAAFATAFASITTALPAAVLLVGVVMAVAAGHPEKAHVVLALALGGLGVRVLAYLLGRWRAAAVDTQGAAPGGAANSPPIGP